MPTRNVYKHADVAICWFRFKDLSVRHHVLIDNGAHPGSLTMLIGGLIVGDKMVGAHLEPRSGMSGSYLHFFGTVSGRGM
jgi:hypothetical protein